SNVHKTKCTRCSRGRADWQGQRGGNHESIGEVELDHRRLHGIGRDIDRDVGYIELELRWGRDRSELSLKCRTLPLLDLSGLPA
ncbi:MAG TPA: hypothetical protein DFS52_02670, partial [Myxococcales bacterium]|nr:hypothetical protein [Myxococcales bacterium]